MVIKPKKAALTCPEVKVLFYEPEGLLLAAGLLPAIRGSERLLMFQLSYLGWGEMSAYVGFDQFSVEEGHMPGFSTVNLLGVARGRAPSTWVTSVGVCADRINCRLVIWGEPGCDDLLRGEIVAEVTGRLPVLSTSTVASVTRAQMPALMDVRVSKPDPAQGARSFRLGLGTPGSGTDIEVGPQPSNQGPGEFEIRAG